ncbi:Cytoplasmic tRNA 2-thiolation protein 1 [Chionoecetes opilio]|uniref:Cytoplasmic tRNA 2-thiolation protein 1 n=1 Tax=Chionoecetes opilio TaxID=41210 RepID=A0A8J4YBU3_CHIOP|nr:Cytoplasmic tRNA 2-thiolation protein 1 [Chionoecetes opilio]
MLLLIFQTGRRSNCTFCGVFRRQALDRGAALLEVDKIVTGHNADDIAETVLMNIMRGDVARLQRCTAIVTEYVRPWRQRCVWCVTSYLGGGAQRVKCRLSSLSSIHFSGAAKSVAWDGGCGATAAVEW